MGGLGGRLCESGLEPQRCAYDKAYPQGAGRVRKEVTDGETIVTPQGNGNAGADVFVRPVADQGAEHHDIFFHKEARGLHADHEVLCGQEFRGSLPHLQSGGDDPG